MKKSHLILIAVGIIILQAVVLYWMGRVWICKCGYIKLWQGVVFSSENSQHLSDWYSFSHIIHGFIFYFFAWLIGRKRGWSFWKMLVLALCIEVGWEILENTSMVINHYRATTISLDYYGDSIINSVMDTLFMVLGFFLAHKLPVLTVIFLIVVMELFVGWQIRDNLTLNIIMLIHPFQFILKWQGG